LEFLSI